MTGQARTTAKIESIQYLRAIAVLAVLIDHAALQATAERFFGPWEWAELMFSGFAGVDLFYIISGFIITVVCLDASLTPKLTWQAFARHRFVRIVPVMWVAILGMAAMRYLNHGTLNVQAYLTSFFLWPVGDLEPEHIWSIRQEMAFYTVFAITFFVRQPWARAVLPLWWLAQCISGLVPPAALGSWGDVVLRPVNVHFGLGVLVGMAWLKGWLRPRFSVGPWLPVVQVAFYLAFSWALYVFDLYDPTVLAHKAWIGVALTLLVVWSLSAQWQDSRPARTLSFLGDASYSIYLFHPHAQAVVLTLTRLINPDTSPAVAVVVASVVPLGMCCLAYLWIEKPLIALFKHRWH